jgi:putative heme transporter
MAGNEALSDAGANRRKVWVRTLKTVGTAVIFYFFVLPLVPGFRKAWNDVFEVDKSMLFLGVFLEFIALLCYSLLTRAALGPEGERVSVLRLFRVQLSTKALGSIMPAGSAASSALGYRLLTLSGVHGPDAGFALATAGIGSAVVLNLILWFGLIVSIPFRGVNALYGFAAIVGVILMLVASALIFGLVEGQGRAERAVRWLARHVRLDADRISEVIRHLGNRLEGLIADRQLLIRVFVWASANWIFDMAAVYVFLRAFGGHLAVDGLIVAFGLANVMAVVPITPGGLGIIEGIYIPTIIGFGMSRATATVGILTYRLAQFWAPIVVGAGCYLSLRVGPWSLDRKDRLKPLRVVAEEAVTKSESKIDFFEKRAPRDRTGQYPLPPVNDDDTGPVG